MGAATALYSATCHVFRQYGNMHPYLINVSSIISLSGWLPCSRQENYPSCSQFIYTAKECHFFRCCLLCAHSNLLFSRTLRNRMETSNEIIRRAASLPILLCHGTGTYIFMCSYDLSCCFNLTSSLTQINNAMWSAENKIHIDSHVKIDLFNV